jgi:hypothetical protein
VFTLPFSGCPDHGFVVCTPLTPGCPNVEPVPPPHAPRSCPRDARLRRFGFPNPRSSLQYPVSQILKRAPSMDPEAMKPVRPRSCPRDRSDLTARVAHTMKPTHPLQLPRPNESTSCTGRPRHEAAPSSRLPEPPATTSLHGAPVRALLLRSVSRTMKPHAARGTRTAEPLRHPVSRAVKQPQLHGSPML